jgi:UDP-glucose 4-epimerase
VDFYEGDLRDEKLLDRIFREHRIDCVVHFAAFKTVGESLMRPLEYYDNNLSSTLKLCRAMDKAGVRKLVFSSSAAVYSPVSPMPLSESSQTGGCQSPYGWTKYLCEQMLGDIAASDSRWSVAVLRYFNPVGAHPSALIGEHSKETPNSLMSCISQVAAGRLEQLSIFGDDYPTPDGTGVRDYIHVVDLARGHLAALDYIEEHGGVNVFNLGTGKGVSVKQLVKAFEQANGVSIPCRIAPRRAGDLAVCYASVEKSRRELGWEAKLTLADMCRDSWGWQKNNPNGYDK